MNIKKNVWALAAALLFTTAFTNCSDWTEVEAENKVDYGNTELAHPESYYEALREWKKSDHSVSFGWFSSWDEPGTSTTSMLMGLPDSLDIVSLWSGGGNLSPAKREDLRMVQEIKGTKVLVCLLAGHIGKGYTPAEHNTSTADREAYWGWPSADEIAEHLKNPNPAVEAAIRVALDKYARAIRDTIVFYHYDGFDFDFEPPAELFTFGNLFIEEMSKYLGPKSNSGLMFVVDGNLSSLLPESATCVDYLVAQAYGISSGSPKPDQTNSEATMESKLGIGLQFFKDVMTQEEITNRYIVTENLESAIDCKNGGFFWKTLDGVVQDKSVCPSLVGMALWQPKNGFRKGGFGGYRFDGEAANRPSYKWMRRAIQAQNPAVN